MLHLTAWQNAIIQGNWTAQTGNFSVFEYYAGIEAGNPSGSTDNVKSISNYNSLGVLQAKQTLEYNLQDNVTKITAV